MTSSLPRDTEKLMVDTNGYKGQASVAFRGQAISLYAMESAIYPGAIALSGTQPLHTLFLQCPCR
jgi:hypothetical protein